MVGANIYIDVPLPALTTVTVAGMTGAKEAKRRKMVLIVVAVGVGGEERRHRPGVKRSEVLPSRLGPHAC